MDSKPDHAPAHFIRHIIDADNASGKHGGRVATRFPPEPNGYLHIGHAKSICLNFGLAEEYGGTCNLRFDDTNPDTEDEEYTNAIQADVRWLGFDWAERLFHASDYFEQLYDYACSLIRKGLAYVDSQSAEEIRATRGSLTEAGVASPWRDRGVEENLDLFARMRAGEFPEGAHILRARIDMASPNINLRDPAIYRIKRATHHRTGDKWCVYPMYTYAHPIEDALENITHSICTLEFEDQRPFYDWVLERLAQHGMLQRPLPQQIEFSRLNMTYTVMSKRFLLKLVQEGFVEGWDDPRMPTLVGARRRGFTPEGFRLFAERIGVSKADNSIDPSVLEDCMREHLNEVAPRRVAVLDPLRLVITNYPAGQAEECLAPNHPQKEDWGKRPMPFSRELWIEREDFQEVPPKGYFRLFPGNQVRLKYGFVVKCTGCTKDASGRVVEVQCEYFPDSKSGTPGANNYKTKGVIHWVSAAHAYEAEVRLYDRLFKVAAPGKATGSMMDDLNPESLKVIRAYLEPSLKEAKGGERFQFERHGYFVIDTKSKSITRTVTLKDSWAGR